MERRKVTLNDYTVGPLKPVHFPYLRCGGAAVDAHATLLVRAKQSLPPYRRMWVDRYSGLNLLKFHGCAGALSSTAS